MITLSPLSPPRQNAVVYPDSDGKPMADNTLQFEWIATIKANLDILFANRPDVFVAGDLLWYPVEGDSTIRVAPDVLVAFDRPKGYRGSYRQWEENGIAPQVVFEILSPGNRLGEMLKKQAFYDIFGVEEYYIYDPNSFETVGLQRTVHGRLDPINHINGWVSPLLRIRFEVEVGTPLVIQHPDGHPFLTPLEIAQERDALRDRAERLAERLRALGVEPDSL